MEKATSTLVHLIRACLIGGIGGFAVAFAISSLALLSDAYRLRAVDVWTAGDFYFSLAVALALGCPAGSVMFGLVYFLVLKCRASGTDLAILGMSTALVGLAGALLALPVGLFTAIGGFLIGAALLSLQSP
jgi:hypothetical protein